MSQFNLPTESVPCDFCGGSDFTPLWSASRHGVPLSTVFCADCGLCQTNPRPTAESLSRFYERDYHTFQGRNGSTDAAYVAKGDRMAADYIARLRQFIPTGSRVIEIGSGAGRFVAAAIEAGWHATGIEPGAASCDRCKADGLPVEQIGAEQWEPTGHADAVVSFHVIEHLASPAAFFAKARRALRIGGVLAIEVPNLSRPNGRLNDFFQLPHLYSFTPNTLRNYMRSAGFEPFYSSERHGDVLMVASAGQPALYIERSDVESLAVWLRKHDRNCFLASLIPPIGRLRKIRENLQTV